MSIAVIGSGICGLWLARMLQDAGNEDVVIFEKSRGVGGRLATRRTDHAKFDHGAQFYSAKPQIASLHQRWWTAGIVAPWFVAGGIQRMKAPGGITTLAKDVAQDLDVKLEHKVVRIIRESDRFQIQFADREPVNTQTVILTCPLPQSLEILKTSEIPYDSSLNQISYAKALVALFEMVRSPKDLTGAVGYVEQKGENIFTIVDQSTKGLCTEKAWSVTMSPEFSERFFDLEDNETIALITSEVRKMDPDFSFTHAQLKRWRYSHPLESYSAGFANPVPGLYLAGDAFGGASVVGAVASANALLNKYAYKLSVLD